MAGNGSKDIRVPLLPSQSSAGQGKDIFIGVFPYFLGLFQESGQVLLTLGLGVALPSAVGYVGAVRESKILLVLYLSPLLLAWGIQLLTLLLLPALQYSIYRGLSSLATSSLSLYQVQSPEKQQRGVPGE